ncbi:MAG: iron ABC transporter substrate-binding protein [Bauldia sp.]
MIFSVRTIAALALAALAPVGIAALPASAQTPAASAGIVVYNAQHATLTEAWAKAFTAETGIKVTLRQGSDTLFANQLVQEGAATPADVFITENSPAMAIVAKAGLFAPLSKPTLALVPEVYRPADGTWIGIAARTTVFAYNKTKLSADKLPKSMLDLADPAWKGRWGGAPAGADFQAIVGALLQLKGESATSAWLKAMKTNATAYRGNGAALRGVNLGEVDGAIIYHYYYFGDQDKTGENSKNVGLHYFRNADPGAFVSISGAGVMAASKNKKEAEAFVAWIAGKGGQAILRDGDSFEYAIGIGADANPKLEPLAKLGAPRVEPATLDSAKVTALMTAAGLL